MMTQKHYNQIARIVRDRRPLATTAATVAGRTGIYVANDVLDGIASDLADMLAADNPRFQRSRFIEACNL